MKYSKPKLIKIQDKMPPITTNFAPPPVEKPPLPGEENDDEWLNQAQNVVVQHSRNGNGVQIQK